MVDLREGFIKMQKALEAVNRQLLQEEVRYQSTNLRLSVFEDSVQLLYPNASKYCLSIPTDYSKLSNLEKKVDASNKNFMAVVEDRDGKLESDLEN